MGRNRGKGEKKEWTLLSRSWWGSSESQSATWKAAGLICHYLGLTAVLRLLVIGLSRILTNGLLKPMWLQCRAEGILFSWKKKKNQRGLKLCITRNRFNWPVFFFLSGCGFESLTRFPYRCWTVLSFWTKHEQLTEPPVSHKDFQELPKLLVSTWGCFRTCYSIEHRLWGLHFRLLFSIIVVMPVQFVFFSTKPYWIRLNHFLLHLLAHRICCSTAEQQVEQVVQKGRELEHRLQAKWDKHLLCWACAAQTWI